jgi:hypothetical protein
MCWLNNVGEIRPIDDRLEEAISALEVEYVLVEQC